MQNVTLKAFDFDELSHAAKQNAYENWKAAMDNKEPMLYEDNQTILDCISEELGININDWRYDADSWDYSVNPRDAERYTHLKALNTANANMNEVTGIRAAKFALKAYYQLTEASIVYGFTKGTDRNISRTWLAHSSHLDKKRVSAFKSVEECFTGYCFSSTFTRGLWNSVAINGAKDSFSFIDHLEAALHALFREFAEDMAYHESYECFVYEDAYASEYLADGSVFDMPAESA